MQSRSESDRSPLIPSLIAATFGIAMWIVVSIASGRREPWDSSAYWSIAYPLAIAACYWLGHRFPERPWRWALLLFESQLLGATLRNGEVSNLWPLSMVMFAVVALPGVAASLIAGRMRKKSA